MGVYNRANNFSAKLTFLFDTQTEQDNRQSLEFMIQDFTTPTRTMGGVVVGRGNKSIELPGDRITEEKSVTLQFLLDENLDVYFQLRELQDNHVQGKTNLVNIVLLNNFSKAIASGSYLRAFIKDISPIQYSLKDNDTNIYMDVLLGFSDFQLKKAS